LALTLIEAKGPGIGLLVYAKDASGNVSEGVFVLPQKYRASKPVLTKPALTDLETESGDLVFGATNYPNPFNPETVIHYVLPEQSDVRLVIYNVLGQQVRELVNAFQTSGRYQVRWDGRNALGAQVTSGVYIYRLVAGSQVEMRKMILVK